MLELRPYQCVLLPDVKIALADEPQAHLLMRLLTGGEKPSPQAPCWPIGCGTGARHNAAGAEMVVFLLSGLVSSQTTSQNIETT